MHSVKVHDTQQTQRTSRRIFGSLDTAELCDDTACADVREMRLLKAR